MKKREQNTTSKKKTSFSKKAQVTIFIILAVVILVIAGILLFLNKDNLTKEKISPDVQPIHSFAQSCIDNIAEDAVFYISERGGFYQPPENTFDEVIPYYLFEEQNHMPSKEKIQQDISTYIDEVISDCINNFTEFPDFEIQQQEIKTTTEIKKDKVVFNINYPLSISKQEQTYNFEKFETIVPIRLGLIYDSIYQIMQNQMKDLNGFDPHYIYEISVENELNIKMNGFIDESVIFVTVDKKSKIDDRDFMFNFANKYIPLTEI